MERNKKVNSRQRRKKPLGSNITQMQKKKIAGQYKIKRNLSNYKFPGGAK